MCTVCIWTIPCLRIAATTEVSCRRLTPDMTFYPVTLYCYPVTTPALGVSHASTSTFFKICGIMNAGVTDYSKTYKVEHSIDIHSLMSV